jgi:hypothetical protein
MAKRNGRVGNAYHNHKVREEKLVEKIDRRDKNGQNMENVDNAYNNYTYAADGSKQWSF